MKRSTSFVNVGIDVGRDRLDVFIHERQLALSYSNDDAGIGALLRRLAYYRLARVVLEATGRREYSPTSNGTAASGCADGGRSRAEWGSAVAASAGAGCDTGTYWGTRHSHVHP